MAVQNTTSAYEPTVNDQLNDLPEGTDAFPGITTDAATPVSSNKHFPARDASTDHSPTAWAAKRFTRPNAVLASARTQRRPLPHIIYVVTFLVVTALSVTFLQWSTYGDPGVTDQTIRVISRTGGQLTQFISKMWTNGQWNWLLNCLIVGLVYLIILLIVNRFWIGTAIFASLMIIFTVANSIKVALRNEPILPSDFGFITGGNASEIGSFIPANSWPLIRRAIALLIVVVALCIALQCLDRRTSIIPCQWRHPFRNANTVIANCSRILAITTSTALLVSFTWNIGIPGSWAYTFATKFGDAPQLWNALGDAQSNGTTMNFLRLAHVKTMDKPEGYSQETIETLVARYGASAEKTNQTRNAELTDSTVILVLSESFSDPTRVPGITLAEDPMPNIRSTKETTTSGLMLSPSIGGGTANIEYQALTGLSLALFDDSLQSPYQELVPHQKQAYAFNQLWNDTYGENGSIAFHPYYKNMYLRDSDYRKFGFTEFLTLDSNPSITHQDHIDSNPYVSDAAAYRNVLDAVSANDQAQFIQLATMQNHIPYNDWYTDNQFRDADSSHLSNDERTTIDNYAKGVNITDQTTADFLSQLDEIDKPVTVIFYGDHLPGIYYTAMADDNNATALHETDYFIWSNQASASAGVKLDAQDTSYTSSNFFMSLAAQHMNAKVSPYLEMLSEIHAEIPAFSRLVSGNGSWGEGSRTYLDADGNVVPYKSLSTKAKKLLKDYELVQYDLTAGKGYLNDTDFFKVE